MTSEELIRYIQQAPKQTPIMLWIKEKRPLPFHDVTVFEQGDRLIVGDWDIIRPVLEKYQDDILATHLQVNCRYSAMPLLNIQQLTARIEPGAIIREFADIQDHAVIMMGAIINTGAKIGEATMVDMNAVVGGRASIGKRCHIGAGAVIAGVIEPASAAPVIIEDDVLIGANAVVLEGVHVAHDAVVAAGAIVIEDVPPHTVVGGCPARVLKRKDKKTAAKTAVQNALRNL